MAPVRALASPRRQASAPPRGTGFTLIELLVVLFIVGLITGVAVLSVAQTGSRQMEQTALRLASQIQLASDEALLTGQRRAVGFSEGRMAILEGIWLDEGQLAWEPIAHGTLAPVNFERQGLRIRVHVEGQRATLDDDPDRALIFLHPDGRITPFEVELARPGQPGELRIHTTVGGRLAVDLGDGESRTLGERHAQRR